MATEKVYTSIYQDVYRICPGVMLLVDKFVQINYPLDKYKQKKYFESPYLKKLDEPVVNEVTGDKYKRGTVLYENKPLKLVNRLQWKYEIKISNWCCIGTRGQMKRMFREIEKIMDKGR